LKRKAEKPLRKIEKSKIIEVVEEKNESNVKLSEAYIQTINEEDLNYRIDTIDLLELKNKKFADPSERHDELKQFSSNYESSKIDELGNLKFNKEELLSLDENMLNEFNRVYFKSNVNSRNIYQIFKRDKFKVTKSVYVQTLNEDEECHEIDTPMASLSSTAFVSKKKESEYLNGLDDSPLQDIKNDENNDELDVLFQNIHMFTKIPKTILNKIKKAFRRKGIFSINILMLFFNKYKSLDVLSQKFQRSIPEIEAVVLYLENVLQKRNF
jgi:hypothetical protein